MPFNFAYSQFFDRSNIFQLNEHFFLKLESSLEVCRAKRKFSGNPGHDILGLYNILVQIRFTTSKRKHDIFYSKLGIRVASRVAKRFKTQDLSKLGNIRKMSNLGGHIVQGLLSIQELKLCEQQLNKTENRYQTFLFLSGFTGLLHFVQNILFWIV